MNDNALDVYSVASILRRWSTALKIPSGDFINEDLEKAADLLDNYARYLHAFGPKPEPGAE